jgi:uncharacterized membrane protein YedE/YeeE
MYDAIFVAPWPWWVAGPAIGLVVILLAWTTGKPLGVSTGYGAVCALTSRLPFFQQPEYAARWRIAFILGLPIGGLLAAALAGGFAPTLGFGALDELTRGSLALKAGVLFVGGLLIGAGARWAGGCPSGHSIVGIAQGAVSSLVATVAFVVSGVVVYNLLVALLGD